MSKIKPTDDLKKPIDLSGLEQAFKGKDGKTVVLKSFLGKEDWWELKSKKGMSVILTHDAVKKIADHAGIKSDPEYSILTQPKYDNNYQYLIQVKICDSKGVCTTEMGESNRSNLSTRGRANPANMAQKRAYDRAVFRHVGITGLLGEDELEDVEPSKDYMNKLTPEESQGIVVYVNELLSAKKKADLVKFQAKMKTTVNMLNENQVDYLRKLFKKKLAELSNTF